MSIFITTASISSPIDTSSIFNGPKSSVLTSPSRLFSSFINRPKSFLSFIAPFTISPILYLSWKSFAGEVAISLIESDIFSFSLSILIILTSTSSPFL